MSIAGILAKIAKVAATNGGDVISAIEAAGAVVTAANILMEQARPILEDKEVKAMVGNLKQGAGNVARGAGYAAVDAAGGAAHKMGALFGKFGDAKDELTASLAQARSEKDLRKAVQEARQSVLENATTSISVSALVKSREKPVEAGFGPINTMPGCFVIATYKKLSRGKDLADYTNIFIGKADNAAEGVDKAISREGDPDVYADVKYKQNVHIYVYNCMPDKMDDLFESLSETFRETSIVVA